MNSGTTEELNKILRIPVKKGPNFFGYREETPKWNYEKYKR